MANTMYKKPDIVETIVKIAEQIESGEWRVLDRDYYGPSLFVTKTGTIVKVELEATITYGGSELLVHKNVKG